MSKQVFINVPVSDVARSTAFYEALGFTKNQTFSNDEASCVMWSDDVYFMLLSKGFYKKFIRGKEIADTTKASGALIALALYSREQVQQFAETAKANGGDYYQIDTGVPEEMMFGYEVEDPDGNQLEPVWMNAEFNPVS